MNNENQLNKNIEFQKAFNSTYSTEPTQLTLEQKKLRFHLLEEEIEEYIEAFHASDFIEKIDAIIDMLYVLNGTIVSHGWQLYFSTIYQSETNQDEEFYIHELKSFNQTYLDIDYPRVIGFVYRAYDSILSLAKINGVLHFLPELFDEVHESNMSKLENGKPIINGENGVFDETRPLGKVLKSKNFREPNIKKVLEAHK